MFENRLEIWPIFDWETAEERRDFVLRVYLLLAAFMAFALLQWLAVLGFFTAKGKELLSAHESAVVLVFAVTMLLFLIFLVSSQVRGMSYLSCFLSMLIVEGLIVSMSFLLFCTDILHMLCGFLCAALLFLLITLIAIFIPLDITVNAAFMYLLTFHVAIMSIYAIILFVRLHMDPFFWVYAAITIFVMLPFTMYHVQCIVGGSSVRVNLRDAKLASLILFYDFLVIFMPTFYVRPKLTGLNKD